MKSKFVGKIFEISIVFLMLTSSIAPCIAVDNSTNNTSLNRTEEFNATTPSNHTPRIEVPYSEVPLSQMFGVCPTIMRQFNNNDVIDIGDVAKLANRLLGVDIYEL